MADQEIELKLQVADASVWPEILQCPFLRAAARPGSRHQERLEAWYYDTADGRLRQQGLAYRVRRERGQWVATVKGGGSSAGGLHQRMEINQPVTGPEADVSVFTDQALRERLVQAVGQDKLVPILITRFDRDLVVIEADGAVIEVAADQGEIIAGGRQAPILEVELELKSGHPAVLLRAGAKLATAFPLLLEPRSKFVRGLLLAGQPAVLEPAGSEQPVSGPVQQLLSLLVEQWQQSPYTGALLAGLFRLQQALAERPEYAAFRQPLASWIEDLNRGIQPDLTRTVPLLLEVWARTLQPG